MEYDGILNDGGSDGLKLVGGGGGSGGGIKLLNDGGGGGGDGGIKLLNNGADGHDNGGGGIKLLNDGSDGSGDNSLLLFLLKLRLPFLVHQTFFVRCHLSMVVLFLLQDHL